MKRIQVLSLLLYALLLLSMNADCLAATDPWSRPVSLDLKDVSLDAALQTLFKDSGLNYVIEAGMRDRVIPRLLMKDVPFSDMLKNILRATGAAYRMEGGIIRISSDPASSVTRGLVNIQVKDAPLSDVLEMLFKNSGFSYTVEPSVSQLKITAVLKDVPFDVALKQVMKAAGVVYRMDKSTYTITARTPVVSTGNGYPPDGANRMSEADWVRTQTLITERVPVYSVQPSDVVPLMPGGVRVSTTANSVLLMGTPDSVDRAKKLIASIDTPDALPHAVRIKLVVRTTITQARMKPTTYEAMVESVGIEGASMPLQITASLPEPAKGHTALKMDNGIRLSVNLTPALAPEPAGQDAEKKSVTLTGRGEISGRLPLEFSQSFNVAVSTAPKQRTVIASGSADLGGGKFEFEVAAIVTIEEGRVRGQSPQGGSYGGGGMGGGGYGGGGMGQRF